MLQSLYERHKIVSYPRTDSRFITADMVPTLPGPAPRACAARAFAPRPRSCLTRPLSPGKRLVDDSKVRDHHAIIPTEEPVRPERLATDERALWELVVRRFLAVLSPPCRFTSIRLVTEAAGERFLTRGSRVIEAGWRAVAGSLDEEEAAQEEVPEQSLAQPRGARSSR